MHSHRIFTLAIFTTLSLSPLVLGSPAPYYYGDSGVPESQGQGGYGYKTPSTAYGVPQSQMDTLLQEFGGIPEFQPMPNGPPIIPYGLESSAAPPTTTTTAAPTTTKAPPPPPPPAPTTTTPRPIVTPITTAPPPPSAPASAPASSEPGLTGKAKILEGVLNVIDGIVEHKANKVKTLYGFVQPKVALVSGILQPKFHIVNERVVKPTVKRIVNHVRPSAVQIVTHYRPAIVKASTRLAPVIQRLTTSIGGLLADPDAASAGNSASTSSSSSPRITIDTNPRQKGGYLEAQSSNEVPVFYFANGEHSSSSYSYDPTQDSDVWSSYY